MKTRKILACLLAMCMIMSVGTTAFAAYDSAAGSAEYYGDEVVNTATDIQVDGQPTALTLENNQANIGGKTGNDVCFKITPANASLVSSAFLYPYVRRIKNYDTCYTSMDIYFDNSGEMVLGTYLYTTNESLVTSANKSIGGICFSTSKGLYTEGDLLTIPENAPKSLAPNQWHNIAVEFSRGASNTTDVVVYIDGGKYKCNVASMPYYGLYCSRAYFTSKTNSTYFDNYIFAKSAYPESTMLPVASEFSVEASDAFEFSAADKKFSVYNSELTAAELKKNITTEDQLRIYTDSTYATQVDDAEKLQSGMVVVTESASGAFRYYDIKLLKCDFSSEGVNKGDKEVTLNVSTTGSTLMPGTAGNGGKLSDDVSLKISTSGGHGGQNYIEAYGVEGINGKGTLYFEISVQAPERGGIAVNYATYTTNPPVHTTYDSSNPAIWTVSDTAVAVAGTKVMDAVPGRWYTLAVEIEDNGSQKAAAYVNGVKYDVKLNSPSYGVRHFRIYPVTADAVYDAYYDNIRYYSSETRKYNVLMDKEATLSAKSDKITVASGNIAFAQYEDCKVADLCDMLEADEASKANIRVYKDNTYTALLEKTDKVKDGSAVVVAATNGCDIERAYSYYDVTMPAKPAPTTAEIILSTNGAGILASINGEEAKNLGEESTASYPFGTEIDLEAVAGEGQEFMYWQENYENNNASLIVSEKEKYSFTVGSSKNLTAVFTDANVFTVSFRSNGRIVAHGVLETVPADPYMAGYTFEGWYKFGGGATELKAGDELESVTENTIYQAAFKKSTDIYNVSVYNAEATEATVEKKQYNDKVEVTAADVEGKTFAYWTKDDKIVSYSKTYSFYVSGATKVKAVYAAEATETPDVVVTIAEPAVVAGNKLAYYAERNVKAGLTVIEAGILLSKSADFDINSYDVKAVAKSTANIGQFTIRKANVTSDQSWYGKAYVIYKDADGVTQFAYSEMVGPNTI